MCYENGIDEANLIEQFKSFGKNSSIRNPIWTYGLNNISIGDDCFIEYGVYLETDEKWIRGVTYNPSIVIEDDVHIGEFCHITCAGEIIIHKGVTVLPQVLITDIEHEYKKGCSLRHTGLNVGSVEIGEFTTIGMGARILGHRGIKIGKNCVIGANSVVTKDVPEGVVVAGIPARIIGEVPD